MARKMELKGGKESWVKCYVNERKSQAQLARELKVSVKWVHDQLNQYGLLYKPEAIKKEYRKENRAKNHRKIMGIFLGRQLKKGEEVHHINFDFFDNRIKNLFLVEEREHRQITSSIFPFMTELVNKGIVGFNKEEKRYYIVSEVKA